MIILVKVSDSVAYQNIALLNITTEEVCNTWKKTIR